MYSSNAKSELDEVNEFLKSEFDLTLQILYMIPKVLHAHL